MKKTNLFVFLIILIMLSAFTGIRGKKTGNAIEVTEKIIQIMNSSEKAKLTSQISCEKAFEEVCEKQYTSLPDVLFCKSLKTKGCNQILKKI